MIEQGRTTGPSAATNSQGARLDGEGRRVLVAMSGGVDSSVAAAVLKEQGWEVAGVTFKLFCYGETGKESKACCGLEGMRDAQSVAHRIGIPHTVLDMEELFKKTVMENFAAEYGRGRTPNPCVECNTHVKFAPLLQWARDNGYDRIATGHYVRLEVEEIDGRETPLLTRPDDRAKDQSYVLWGVPGDVLEKTLFPLGEMGKPAVREHAKRLGLPVWDKEESQDICFVDERGYVEVLREQLGGGHPLFEPGPIVGLDGRVLGQHKGLVHYTIGQRRGLSISGPDRFHVVRIDPSSNRLVVGSEEDLLVPDLVVDALNFFVPPSYVERGPVDVKIRYRHEPARARVRVVGDRLEVRLEQPQRAVAPGQSCVVYRDGHVLAGGRIRTAGDGASVLRDMETEFSV